MRLLIAHGAPSFAAALTRQLEGELTVRSCTDGETAVQLLDTWEPELLILQAELPWRDGFGVLTLAAHRPAVVIVVSCYIDVPVARRFFALGAARILLMPTVAATVDALTAAIGTLPTLLPPPPAEAVLHRLGFRPSLTGFHQILRALELLQADPTCPFSDCLYDHAGVEKAIRTAIHHAWREGDPHAWHKYFPGGTCPGNKTFLLTLLRCLKSGY